MNTLLTKKLRSEWVTRPISSFFTRNLSGEWGSEPTSASSPLVVGTPDFNNDGTITWDQVKRRDIAPAKLNTRLLFAGNILVEKSGGSDDQPAGRVVYCDRTVNGTCSNFVQLLSVDDRLHSRFIFYLLYYHYKKGLVYPFQQKTTGIINFKIEEYFKTRISLPGSVEEQSAIVDILSTVDEAIDKSEVLIAKLTLIKQGLMQDLLTRGIDENGNIRSENTHKFKDSPLGKIPEEWEIKNVSNLFEIQLGKMLSKKAKTGKAPKCYLGNKNVQWERVSLADLETMDFTKAEMTKFSLKSGDLLVCEGGDVGRTAIWRHELEDCYFQKAVHRLRPKEKDEILPQFMLYFMQTTTCRHQLINLVSQTSIAHLTQEKLALLNVIVPALPEQVRILDILDEQTHAIDAEQILKSKFVALKSGLMEDLLTGKVRVNNLLKQ